jgi:hypothetical protein
VTDEAPADLGANMRAAFAEWKASTPEPPRSLWPKTKAELRDALRLWVSILPKQNEHKR